MTKEFDYVLVESGDAPTKENNLMPNVVRLTEGEASFTNEELVSFNSTQKYVKLEESNDDQNNPNKKEEVLGLNRVVMPPYDDGSIRMEISKERGQDDSSLS